MEKFEFETDEHECDCECGSCIDRCATCGAPPEAPCDNVTAGEYDCRELAEHARRVSEE